MAKSKKRKSNQPIEDGTSSNKRVRIDPSSTDYDKPARVQPATDATTGQRFCFPGLDEGSSDQDLEGEPENGLQYLRRVR